VIRSAGVREQSPAMAIGAAALCAAAAILGALRELALKGRSGLLEIAAVLVAPLAAWWAWSRPLLFPYGLYAILVPLDVLTQLSAREGTVAKFVGIAAGAALLLYAIRTRSVRMPPRALVWLLLLCGWMALSTLWSLAGDAGLEVRSLLQLAALYTIVATFPTQRRDVLPLLGAVALGGIVSAAIGIYEFHVGGMQQAESLQDFHRLAITLGRDRTDPNLYSDGLLLPFAVALVWFIRSRRLLGGVAALGTMGVLLVAVMLAGSRDAAIGIGIETVVMVALLRSWKKVILPVAALGAIVLAAFPNVIVRSIADSGTGADGRTSIWRVGLTAFLHHPFAGTGAGSYATTYDRWYLRVFERIDPGWSMASHDIVLHYGVELGIVGLVLVAGWCVSQWLLARSLPRLGLLGDLRAICMASLAAFAFVSFFIDVFDMKFVWLAFGLIAQCRNVALYESRT
jgi:hypothetical protein